MKDLKIIITFLAVILMFSVVGDIIMFASKANHNKEQYETQTVIVRYCPNCGEKIKIVVSGDK